MKTEISEMKVIKNCCNICRILFEVKFDLISEFGTPKYILIPNLI